MLLSGAGRRRDGLEPQDPAGVGVYDEIEQPIGALADIADALAQRTEHQFASGEASPVHPDAPDARARERTEEELTLPPRVLVAAVDHHP